MNSCQRVVRVCRVLSLLEKFKEERERERKRDAFFVRKKS